MSIIRLPADSIHLPVSIKLAQDNSLSFEARGVMFYLLTHSDDFALRAEDIESAGNIGREKRQRIIGELERAGYITYRRVQGDRGHWSWEIQVHEEPVPSEDRTHEISKGGR